MSKEVLELVLGCMTHRLPFAFSILLVFSDEHLGWISVLTQ